MKRSVRVIAAILVLAFAAALAPFSAFAYGASDKRLSITHINTPGTLEGAGIIESGGKYATVSASGSTFAWYKLLVFDWDDSERCFKVVSVLANSNNSPKGNVQIPEKGFAYAVCTGNNYPALVAQGQTQYEGRPNYVNAPTKDSCEYITAANIKVGDKAYLYNTDLGNGVLKNNGKEWYDPEYVSESFIQLGEPVEGLTPYDPDEEHLIGFSITPTQIDKIKYAVNESIIFTPNYGSNANNGGIASFEWWTGAIFEYDPSQECYVVQSVDRYANTGASKQAVIPSNGFALMDCGANTSAINNLNIGAKCWVYDMDLAAGTFGDSPRIVVNEPEETAVPYKPAAAELLAQPAVKEAEDGVVYVSESGAALSWDAVPGAEKYVVSLNNAANNPDGALVIAPEETAQTSFTVGGGKFATGGRYTLRVVARSQNGYSLLNAYTVVCLSEQAKNSSLRHKKIVAFGDSLTARAGYVDMLYGYLGTEVINAGVGGDSTNNGMNRFKADVLDKDPDIVTICFGMNDQACVISGKRPNVSLETYRANLEYFAKTLTEAGKDVVFVTPNPPCTASGYYVPGSYGLDYAYGFLVDFCNVMREVAHKYDCGLVDINYECDFEDMKKFLNAGDGIHQSVYGHTRYAECISDYLFAVYDGTDRAVSTVKCVDTENKVLFTREIKGKKGAHYTVATPELEGYYTADEDIKTVLKDGEVYTFTYRSEADKPDFMPGDVNGNGRIDASDYAMCKRAYLRTYTLNDDQFARADINGNKKLDAAEYAMIKRHCLKTYVIPGTEGKR